MAEADHPPTNNEPIEIAMEALAQNAPPGGIAHTLLERQVRLVNAEIAQLRRRSWRDYILTALAALLLVAAGSFIWSASRASGLVVEPFEVPSDLAQRGLTGNVVAQQLLDKLSTLQDETVSLRASSTYANSWGDDIEVEVPYAGVSVGELRRVLRQWLGNQTRLSGEVVRLTDGRIAVAVRVGASPASRFEGAETDLDALLQQNAEAVYRETQPYRYAVWLRRAGRLEETAAIYAQLTSATNEHDRLWGHIGQGNLASDYKTIVRHYRAALAIRPDFTPAISNLAIVSAARGDEELACRYYGRLLAHADAMRRELEPGRAEALLEAARAERAACTGDYAAMAVANRKILGLPKDPGNQAFDHINLAVGFALVHDVPGMRRVLADAGLGSAEAIEARLEDTGWAADPRPMAHAALGEWTSARDLLAANLSREQNREADILDPDAITVLRAQLAVAQARTGHIAEAVETIRATPEDCAPCVRARGIIAAHGRRPDIADRWFREAVRKTPSLPFAHGDWAEALLLRGDIEGAIAQARLANRKGPRWAEPLKTWGDALMRAGQPRRAARRYRAAARLTPHWGALHIAWGEALAADGDPDGALEEYRAAGAMHLSRADRARLRALLEHPRGRR